MMPVVTYTCTVTAAVTRDYKFNLAGTETVQSGLGGGGEGKIRTGKIVRDTAAAMLAVGTQACYYLTAPS